MTISRDEHERARLLSEYKYQVDMQSKLVTAKREGKIEGKRELLITISHILLYKCRHYIDIFFKTVEKY